MCPVPAMAASRALYPATPRSSWLGRAKHVTFDGPAKWQVIVGVPTSVFVDLSRARPAGENRPPSRLRVEVLDGYSAKAGSPEPLVVWSVERSVSNDSDSLEVPVGPLAVAGDLHIAVYLDGQAVRDSPQPLHVTPAPPSAAHSELIGGPTGSRVVAVAGAPAVFFVLLRDGCGNRCVGGLRAHLQQHYAAALHLMRSMAAGPPRPPQDDHAGIHGSGAVSGGLYGDGSGGGGDGDGGGGSGDGGGGSLNARAASARELVLRSTPVPPAPISRILRPNEQPPLATMTVPISAVVSNSAASSAAAAAAAATAAEDAQLAAAVAGLRVDEPDPEGRVAVSTSDGL